MNITHIVNEAQQEVAKQASEQFMAQVNIADGYIPKYDGREKIIQGVGWYTRLQDTLDGPLSEDAIGVGVVVSTQKITDHCLMVYTDASGDHQIDHCYVVET